MTNNYEHPEITRAERTGYPSWYDLYDRHLMGHSYEGEGVYDEDFDHQAEIDEEEVFD